MFLPLIYSVKEIPRTISGKKVEIAITKISNEKKVRNNDALLKPNSLLEYKKLFKINKNFVDIYIKY